MKIEIKTKVWDSKDWRTKIINLVYVYSVFCGINMILKKVKSKIEKEKRENEQ